VLLSARGQLQLLAPVVLRYYVTLPMEGAEMPAVQCSLLAKFPLQMWGPCHHPQPVWSGLDRLESAGAGGLARACPQPIADAPSHLVFGVEVLAVNSREELNINLRHHA
jgi:hypothetical protein